MSTRDRVQVLDDPVYSLYSIPPSKHSVTAALSFIIFFSDSETMTLTLSLSLYLSLSHSLTHSLTLSSLILSLHYFIICLSFFVNSFSYPVKYSLQFRVSSHLQVYKLRLEHLVLKMANLIFL